MISVPGKINIRTISGRFGSFNVGTLDCSIGSFTVKDPSIDEFDEGVYEGNFVIEQIKPNSYFTGGRMVVEVRAKLSALMIDNNSTPTPVEPESLEQDPLEENYAHNERDFSQHQQPLANTHCSGDTSNDDDLATLFGTLWPIGSIVKLDPTIDRGLFRQQKDYLKNSGYRFEAATQIWKTGV